MNAIVAVNSDWGIGCRGTQTIVIPDDRRRFMKLTSGGTVITGRRTFEDIGALLPKRKNIILTGNREYTADGAVIRHSVNGVLDEIAGEPPERVFVIGGESIYRQFLPMCEKAYVTKIKAAPPSDTFFPNLDELPEWELLEQSPVREEPENLRYSFTLYKNSAISLP